MILKISMRKWPQSVAVSGGGFKTPPLAANRAGSRWRIGGAALLLLLLLLFAGFCNAQVAVTTIAGSGTAAFADGTAGSAFWAPSGMAVDASGNVFVGDYSNNRIRKVTPGGAVTTLAGGGTGAFTDGTGANASFTTPKGVAFDVSGNSLLVADQGNHRVRSVSPGGVVTSLAGSGSAAFANGIGTGASFNNPYAVAVDTSGICIVTDTFNHRICRVTPGGVVTTLAGSGVGGFADGTGAGASFNTPSCVAIDAGGVAFIGEAWNHRIRRVTPGGVVTTLAGSGSGAFADGTGASASFNAPRGAAFDASGNLFVADSGNNRIRRVTPGGVVTTRAGSGAA